ncbi:MotA/TolQ/ExbB proton channel family protein [Hydrocarboniphaga effusa]|jgi:biopolymer transport protein ExbB|uniref:MotA/TolQ/ExbB proton channel family protein n=1 Tax=Hydrocarboniphaga effusa TaxID=243629 RepID=UPI0035AEE922
MPMLEALLVPYRQFDEFLDLGGWVVGWIVLCALVMWTLVLERSWFLLRIYPQLRNDCVREWREREERTSWTAQRIRTAMVSELRLAMESGLPIIRVMVPMSPLLGLLGTVVGMLQVFDAMTAARSADTRAMADGISHAMIATMAGLVVSLLGLFCAHLLGSRVKLETAKLNDLLDAAP